MIQHKLFCKIMRIIEFLIILETYLNKIYYNYVNKITIMKKLKHFNINKNLFENIISNILQILYIKSILKNY
jgi:uncharacterized membrane protein